MRFFIDENVAADVHALLRRRGHDVELSVEVLAPGASDHTVATATMARKRILVTHDSDFRPTERKCSAAWRSRYPTLCRLMFQCPELLSARRLAVFLPALELELGECEAACVPMLFEVQERRIRIHR